MPDYTIALYKRLSSEDGDLSEAKGESNSISNQSELLKSFVQNNPEFDNCRILEFCDDGYSGTNFNRPGVREMLEQVKAGKINCIVVKDGNRFLSRQGEKV